MIYIDLHGVKQLIMIPIIVNFMSCKYLIVPILEFLDYKKDWSLAEIVICFFRRSRINEIISTEYLQHFFALKKYFSSSIHESRLFSDLIINSRIHRLVFRRLNSNFLVFKDESLVQTNFFWPKTSRSPNYGDCWNITSFQISNLCIIFILSKNNQRIGRTTISPKTKKTRHFFILIIGINEIYNLSTLGVASFFLWNLVYQSVLLIKFSCSNSHRPPR